MVSIIMPAYNAAETIIDSVKSVFSQTFKDWEIIIIDDGSKDDTLTVLDLFFKTLSENDLSKIKLIKQINHGVSKARNVGLQTATGNWIALLDSDDIWMANKLERQMGILLENSKIDFLGANRKGEHYDSFLNIKFGLLTRLNPKNLLYKNFFPTSTVIFKREIIEEIGFFDENQKYCEDVNYFIKISHLKECYLLNESLVVTGGGGTHFQEKGLSSNLWAMQKGELSNLNYALNAKIISYFDFLLLFHFSFIKYFRRVWLVKIKK
jgi:glycosyltransferase involved in cell wall biosynthesis